LDRDVETAAAPTGLLGDPDPEKAQQAMPAMLQMTKIDIEALRKAAAAA